MNQSHSQSQCKNLDYDNELNKRLENRNTPSAPLQPIYDIRPVATKYTMFHTVDQTNQYQYHKQCQKHYQYDPHQIFNPGDKAPIDYFIRNIDVESTLRSQFFALQKSPQALYVPELNSQLYENPMAYSNPVDCFSPTDATNSIQCKNQYNKDNQTLFYNCIKTNSKK
jgi:hypothetical protein